jgi:hypothetical protein
VLEGYVATSASIKELEAITKLWKQVRSFLLIHLKPVGIDLKKEVT